MDLQLDAYCLHYFLDTPHLAYMNSNSIISETNAKKLKCTQYLQYEVPNIFRFVYDIINKKPTHRYPCIHLVNDTSKKVVQVIKHHNRILALATHSLTCLKSLSHACSW